MKTLFIRILTFFNTVRSKIAFYPTLVAFGGILTAFVMMIVESEGVSQTLVESVPNLLIEDGDTALTIMSACIGGLISMMVFSFSMVMLLLSQASSNFSPRLLPGLISDKTHQIILGLYLGTIMYNIFTLFSIEPTDEKYTLPGLSILLGIFLTILCLCAFIYFIHNISQSIQINNILDTIYDASKERLKAIIQKEKEKDTALIESFPDTDQWHCYTAPVSGYFQNISYQNIQDICKEQKTKIYITVPQGVFVLQHRTFFKSEKELDEETRNELFSNINFARGELIGDNYILAFKQMTEIIVKAMSPGINDPGTAINAIDYITELFALRMQKRDSGILISDDVAYLKIAVVTFKELLYNVMASIRTYCKHDPIIVQKLILMLTYLKEQKGFETTYEAAITAELDNLIKDAERSFENEYDIQAIRNLSALN